MVLPKMLPPGAAVVSPPAMQVIDPATWTAQPWRNRAGTTHELVRWPADERFAVRISVADLTAPAPFSAFPGYQRWLYLLDGGPVTLAVDGAAVVLAAVGDGVGFPGAAEVAATAVAHPSRDLNFMASAAVAASVEILRGPATVVRAGAAVAVFAIAGEITATSGDHRRVLGRHACAWATDAEVTVALAAGALAAGLVVAR